MTTEINDIVHVRVSKLDDDSDTMRLNFKA